MNIVEKFDVAISVAIKTVNDTTYEGLNALAGQPETATAVAAAIIASPLIGFSLRTLDTENTFILNSISRILGNTTLIGALGVTLVATAGLLITGIDDFIDNYQHYSEVYKQVFARIALNAKPGFGIGAAIGTAFFVFSRTIYAKALNALEAKITWATVLPVGVPTEKDIQKLKVQKISQPKLNHWINNAIKKQEIFVGVDSKKKPIFISLKKALDGCWQVSGEPGAGKGVFNQNLFIQLIKYKHINIIFNPKPDEYARTALSSACKASYLPFYRLDLTAPHPVLNVLANCTEEEVFEIFCSGFGLENTALESSYFAAVARRILRQLIDNKVPTSIDDLLKDAIPLFNEVGKDSANIHNKLVELSLVKATQTEDATPLFDVFNTGGCLLIEGTPNNESVLTLMKMLHVRVVQLASNRMDTTIPVNIWLDESKYAICQSVINGLGTSRSYNFRYSITVQSNADFEATQLPFSSSAIREIINDDTPFRVAYATRSRETAVHISEHCGTEDRYVASSSTAVNELATETDNGERHISISEGPIFHPNLIQNLPRGMAIITGALNWPTLVTIPTLEVSKLKVPAFKAAALPESQKSSTNNEDLL